MSNAVHSIPKLDEKGLRDFGIVTGGIVAALFGLFFPWLLDFSLPLWPWMVFIVLGVWGLAAPLSLQPVYRAWMRFGLLLSRITTPIIMGAVFYLIFTPIGLTLRLTKWDPLNRRFETEIDSYRVTCSKSSKENLEKPF